VENIARRRMTQAVGGASRMVKGVGRRLPIVLAVLAFLTGAAFGPSAMWADGWWSTTLCSRREPLQFSAASYPSARWRRQKSIDRVGRREYGCSKTIRPEPIRHSPSSTGAWPHQASSFKYPGTSNEPGCLVRGCLSMCCCGVTRICVRAHSKRLPHADGGSIQRCVVHPRSDLSSGPIRATAWLC